MTLDSTRLQNSCQVTSQSLTTKPCLLIAHADNHLPLKTDIPEKANSIKINCLGAMAKIVFPKLTYLPVLYSCNLDVWKISQMCPGSILKNKFLSWEVKDIFMLKDKFVNLY